MIKRNTLIAALMVLISTKISAQNHFIGIQGGFSMTNIQAPKVTIPKDTRIGETAGMFYNVRLFHYLNLGVDVNYIRKGFKSHATLVDASGNVIAENGSLDYTYDYLSIPFKVGGIIGDRWQGFVNIGLAPTFLLGANATTPSAGGGTQTYDIKDAIHPTDLVGIAELGGSFLFSDRFALTASCTYNQSFRSFADDYYFSGNSMKHYGLNVRVGIKYALQKK